MVGDCVIIKEHRFTGQLVPQTDSQCPLVTNDEIRSRTGQPLLPDTVRSRGLFLPRDALMHSAVLRLHVVRLSVCLSVCL